MGRLRISEGVAAFLEKRGRSFAGLEVSGRPTLAFQSFHLFLNIPAEACTAVAGASGGSIFTKMKPFSGQARRGEAAVGDADFNLV